MYRIIVLLLLIVFAISCNKEDSNTVPQQKTTTPGYPIDSVAGKRLFTGYKKSYTGSTNDSVTIDTITLNIELFGDTAIIVKPGIAYDKLERIPLPLRDTPKYKGWVYFEFYSQYAVAGLYYDTVNNKIEYFDDYHTSSYSNVHGYTRFLWEK